MLTLDQARIAAPEFPRPQEWWDRFLPDWMTSEVRADGTVHIDVTGEAHPSQGPRHPSAVRRSQELAAMRWLFGLPQLEPAIVEDACPRCQCWDRPASLHGGHCCFRHARICHAMPEAARGTAAEPDGNDQPLTRDEIVHEARYASAGPRCSHPDCVDPGDAHISHGDH